MGKKKGKKPGQTSEGKEVPTSEQAGGTGDAPPVQQPDQSQGAVGGAQQKGKQQTPPPGQTISESTPPLQQPEQSQGDVGGTKQRKKKGKQTVQTISEPAGPPKKEKKTKEQQHEHSPSPAQTISEPLGPPKQQRRDKEQELTPPPAKTGPTPPSDQSEQRPGVGRGRGQQQALGRGKVQGQQQPSGRGRGQGPGQQQPSGRGRDQGPGQQQAFGRGQDQPYTQPAGHMTAQPPQVGRPREHIPPQQTVSPPPGIRPQIAPHDASRGLPPGIRGPSPPQQGRPAPGTLVPVMRQQAPDSGVAAITKGIHSLQLPVRKRMDRCGTKGRPIIVETNHLSLNFSKLKNKIAIHYDVTLDPNVPKRLFRDAMRMFQAMHYPDRYPAFDGRKNLYSSGELPFGREAYGEVEVLDPETNRNKTFKITIKYASKVDLDSLRTYMSGGTSLSPPQEAIQAIDIVLRNAPAFKFVQVGRSFFTPPRDSIIQLGDGLELWYGFFQSAILGWKPFVNVDVAHKGFPTAQSVPKAMCEILRIDPAQLQQGLSTYQKADFLKYIKGLKIDYMITEQPNTKRTYKVNNLVGSAIKQRFELDNGQNISVGEYFEREKRVRLRYPNLPCLHVGSINRPKPIYVPAELCSISKGQVTNRKMNENQTSNMIKQAATSTDVRKQKIYDSMRSADFNNDRSVVGEFGLSVSDRFERVGARILDPPRLEYSDKSRNNHVNPSRGVWRPEQFLSTNQLRTWVILSLDRYVRNDHLQNFGREMQNVGRGLGMVIDVPTRIDSLSGTRDLQDYFKNCKKNNVQLVVVVIPDKGSAYSMVKREAEVNVGVLTQCIKGRTMQRMNAATCSNILLKVNSKLNGVNHAIAPVCRPRVLKRPVMIVGADVTHPSPDQTDIPSVAAVCASHDPKAFKYNIQFRLQPPRVEIIEDLEAIMKQQLMFFYRAANCKPERILFFRDGVSEGQFSQVLNNEVTAIRRACSSLEPGYKPQVTFLVVQKRHHTRFFPTRDQDADGKNRNVPAGTIVDQEITHPTEVDFYLVSHASIQGVSRPTKYRLLWNDDDDMTEDEIEEITYYLCHMFSRCSRSVSYPAPTYYAHLAAFRARAYLEGRRILLTNLESEQRACTILEDIISKHPMFFV